MKHHQDSGRPAANGTAHQDNTPTPVAYGSSSFEHNRAQQPIAGATGDRSAASTPSTSAGPIAAPVAAQVPRWDRIPPPLRGRPQWLLAAPDDNGKLKRPMSVDAATGALRDGSSTNRSTWLSFETAAAWARHLNLGVGYVLSYDDPFTCIDLDVKRQSNEPNPEKWTSEEQLDRFNSIFGMFNTYAEVSQSGLGLHIWCRGKIGKGAKRDGVEVYSQERFIVCTGNAVAGKPEHPEDCQELLSQLIEEVRRSAPAGALVELPPVDQDEAIWRRASTARNGGKFRALCDGRWQQLCYPSQSEADTALIGMLVFYSPSNEQVRRMFHQTALGQRSKAHRRSYLDGLLAVTRSTRAAQLEAVRQNLASLLKNQRGGQ